MSVKKIFTLFAFSLFLHFASAQKSYRYTINLNEVTNDKIKVELYPPAHKNQELTYSLPKIVPGTYSEDDFGRFVESFKAYNKKGDTIPVERLDVNSWKIMGAKNLHKISYLVNDSFDDSLSKKKVFEPCGSNIQEGLNYVLNTHCFMGYFDGLKELPFEVEVLHPSSLYGTTAMSDFDKKNDRDLFKAKNYNYLVDNPIMYAAPDTATIRVGKSEVLIGVYSPNQKTSARFLADRLGKLLDAQVKYMGGKMPVDKYAFLVYLTDKPGISGSQGALEHSYSSMYFMPEGTGEAVVQFFLDVAAHEFFHIITPLNLHAEQIHYFDYNKPSMSEHLWLYEGTTEYHAHLAQARYGLITKEAFLSQMQRKITSSKNNFNDTLPFTVMSAHVLHEHARQFGNVYQKGALIAMCLDILLRKESGGKQGIMDMINALSAKFGPDKPFTDKDLFHEIGKIAPASVPAFLQKYVAGSDKLPLNDILSIVGVNYIPVVETKDSAFTFGSISFGANSEGKLFISDVSKMNDFGKAMGFKKGDIIEKINETAITARGINAFISNLITSAKVGDPLIYEVTRVNSSGNNETVKLTGTMTKLPTFKYNVLELSKEMTEQQKTLMNSWLVAGK